MSKEGETMASDTVVSVIIPIFNMEDFLEECLTSVANQTHRALEIICIDDGSTDSSADIMRSFAARDDRFICIGKANEGYGASCNRGLDIARGEYLAIVEPDDFIDAEMYADMVAFAEESKLPDIVKTPWTYVMEWNDPKTCYDRPCELVGRLKTTRKPRIIQEMPRLLTSHPSIWSAIYRADFINANRIRFPEYPGAGWADNPFAARTLCQAKTIAYLDKAYYHYRFDLPGSTKCHKTDEAIALPFDRWMDMDSIVDELGARDKVISQALAQRAFYYLKGAVRDDGADNPVVIKKATEMFARIEPETVSALKSVDPTLRALYWSLTGQNPRAPRKAAYMASRAGEALWSARNLGVRATLKRG